MSRLVSTLSLDGDRISAELLVHFQRALSNATAESIADEIAKATTEILGDQITQGEVPLSKEELVARVRTRISASAARITEIEVKGLYLLGSEANVNRSHYRTRPASLPPALRAQSHQSGSIPTGGQSASFPGPALTPPPAPQIRTLWPRALSSCAPGTPAAEVGRLLGPALRDSVAAAVLHSFVAIDPEAADRMALFAAEGAVREILLEVCACFSAAAYRIFVSNEIAQSVASELVRVAIRHVLPSDEFPAQQVGHYMSSESPVRELSIRVAAAIGAPEMPSVIQTAMSPYCEALRNDLFSVASRVRQITAQP